MKISKAVRMAAKEKRGIRREGWPGEFHVIPTNTTFCCITASGTKEIGPRWQPKADDLTADDWTVYG